MSTVNARKNENDGVDSTGNTIQEENSSFVKEFDHRILPCDDDSNSEFEHGDIKTSQGHAEDQNEPFGADGEPSIEIHFLPPDQRPGHPGDLLAAVAVVEPEIEDDTEAAEALRANARIKVGKVSKAARSINAQSVRKFVKRASLRGSGIKRGKPPRVPPGLAAAGQHHHQQFDHEHQMSLIRDEEENRIYALQEEDGESALMVF